MADEEEYFIEPLSPGANVSAGAEGKGSPHVVYKRSSLQYPHMDAACGVMGRCSHRPHPQPSPKQAGKILAQQVLSAPRAKEPNLSSEFEVFLCLFLPISGGFGKLLSSPPRSRALEFVNRAWNRREKNTSCFSSEESSQIWPICRVLGNHSSRVLSTALASGFGHCRS